MSPALNESSAIRRFKHGDAIEIDDGITFDFYMGLPHIRLFHLHGVIPLISKGPLSCIATCIATIA